jgi:hypothetical protein
VLILLDVSDLSAPPTVLKHLALVVEIAAKTPSSLPLPRLTVMGKGMLPRHCSPFLTPSFSIMDHVTHRIPQRPFCFSLKKSDAD